MIDAKKSGERQQTILPQPENIFGAGLAHQCFFFVNVGILIELRQTLVQPQRHELRRLAQKQVRVFVVDDGVRMFALCVQSHEYVVLVGSTEKQSAKLQRSPGKIFFRFERAEIFRVLYSEHDDGRARVDLCFGKRCVKDGSHPLKLIGDVAALLLVCVGDYYEMRAGNLDPALGFIARGHD